MLLRQERGFSLTTPIMHGDLSCLARRLLPVPVKRRPGIARDIINRAVQAQEHRIKTGKAGVYGNGSIMAAARMYCGQPLPSEPTFDDPDYVSAMICALEAIQQLNLAQEEAA